MNDWFLKRDGRTQGPFSAEQMQEMARTGELRPDTEVRNGENEWSPARNHRFLIQETSAEPKEPDVRIERARSAWPISAPPIPLDQPVLPTLQPLASNRQSARFKRLFAAGVLLIAVTTLLIAVLIFRAVNGIGTAVEEQQKGAVQWEYHMTFSPDNAANADLAEFGNNGWEMVSARRAKANERWGYEWIFKRRKAAKF